MMGRRSSGLWLERGLAIAQDLIQAFPHEREEVIIQSANDLGVTRELARRWLDAAVYVQHWSKMLGVDEPRASLSTVEGLRSLETLDYAKARSIKQLVLSGLITEHKVRDFVSEAASGRREVPDVLRSIARDAIVNYALSICNVLSPEVVAVPPSRDGLRTLSIFGGKFGLDAEIADERAMDVRIGGTCYQFALVVSPQLACATNVGRAPEFVLDVAIKAAAIYDEVVYAAVSAYEIHAIQQYKAIAYQKLDHIRVIEPVVSKRAVKWRAVPPPVAVVYKQP